ncbi:glycosyltransferase family 2 protein [Bacteroides fragilis]|uniref:glycosyltransferase family 2 protein n=1 Tax=Bacteroides fragilis TaxID=817 RepID=UPI00202EBFBF|nr:glycosyltransferase [Bacteroides fragilis]
MNIMSENPLVSIITPVYNVERYLSKCIESILNQTYANFELLLINDGSEDSSGYLCDTYASKDVRIKVFHQKNAGVSFARNVGLGAVKGDWVTFVDADDWIEPFFLEEFLKAVTEKDIDMVVYASYFDCKEQFTKRKYVLASDAINNLLSFRGFPTSLCLTMYSKKIIKDNCLSLEIHHWEDFEFQYRMLLNTVKVGVILRPAYHYLMREGSATHSEINSKIMSCMKIPQIVQLSGSITKMQSYNIYAYFIFQCMIAYCKSHNPHSIYRSNIIHYIKVGMKSIIFSDIMKKRYKVTLIAFSKFPNLVYKALGQKYRK